MRGEGANIDRCSRAKDFLGYTQQNFFVTFLFHLYTFIDRVIFIVLFTYCIPCGSKETFPTLWNLMRDIGLRGVFGAPEPSCGEPGDKLYMYHGRTISWQRNYLMLEVEG